MSQEVSSTVIIAMPREQAWEKLRDLSVAHHYVPGLVDTRIVTKQREGVGASRYVYRSANSYIQETVTEWTQGHGFIIKLHKGDKPAPPFKEAWFRYQIDDASPAETRFTASMGFTLPWGAFGAWLEKRMTGFVDKTIADVALGMKLYYESGEPVSDAARKAYKASADA
jgi:hypothetical protein